MIVDMQKVAVLSVASGEAALLKQLRELGVLHITQKEKPERRSKDSVSDRIKAAQSVINTLMNCPKGGRVPEITPEETIRKVQELTASISADTENAQKLTNQLELLSAWGDFDPNVIRELRKSGVIVKLYSCQEEQEPEAPYGVIKQVIAKAKGQVYFALCGREDFNLELQEVSLPEKSTKELKLEREGLLRRAEESTKELNSLRGAVPALEEYLKRLDREYAYACAFDSVTVDGKIVYLEGFVPEPEMGKLIETAKAEGWGLWYEKADRNDPSVPTLLDLPGWLKPVKVVFDFIDAMPGYNECDVSLPVMIYFTLFFSIIVGDAGYGLIYLIASIILKLKVKAKAAQPAIIFLIILSCGTVVWGLLNGAFFGIAKDSLPPFLQGLPCLRGEKSMACVQWFCFAIALTHLAGARIWRAIIAGSVREALGNLGWMFFITCNFFAIVTMIVGDTFPFVEHTSVQSFPVWCYVGGVIGAVLILLFSVNWGSIGDVLYTPFNFINSFVDVLSYIRLFAVGLSGTYIATCFNSMGAMLYEGQTGWKLIVFGICGALVIVIGHVLNIALGMMSVLVHGLRLNTLEFSNHMQINWEGKAYKPFGGSIENN
ncbi:hypothetical protein J6X96_02465 [bacterium]|nr:hypothetical protein [bacterium]